MWLKYELQSIEISFTINTLWQDIHAGENRHSASYTTSSGILLLPIKRPHLCSLPLDPSSFWDCVSRRRRDSSCDFMWLLRQGHKSALCPRLLFLGCLLLEITYPLWETQAAHGETHMEGSEVFILFGLVFRPLPATTCHQRSIHELECRPSVLRWATPSDTKWTHLNSYADTADLWAQSILLFEATKIGLVSFSAVDTWNTT